MKPGKLSDAQQQMQQSKEKLQDGQPGQSLPSQNQALESLREGKKQMQQQMQPSKGGKKPGKGQGKGPGQGQGEDGKSLQDPSATDGQGASENVQEGGQSGVHRGRQIIEDLRRLQDGEISPETRRFYQDLENGPK